MGAPAGTQTTAPWLAGRKAERRRVRAVIASVAGGGGAVVLVAGKSGIGKTRLARHALGLAAGRGFRTLDGASNPLSSGIAYAPFVEAVGRALRDLDRGERQRLTADLHPLGWLLPDLGLPVAARLGDPALDRTRLFEAMLRLLDRLSRRRPLALLLDDLHWFDAASLELLGYVVRDLASLPILVVATVRLEEQRAEVGALLQLLRRTRLVEEFTLSPLDEPELAELAARALGGSPPPGLVDHLVEHSLGVPLVAEAILDALRQRGTLAITSGEWTLTGPVAVPRPPVVRDALLSRLGGLTPAEHRVVEALAVAGGDVAPSVLADVTGCVDAAALLARLVDRGLVVEHNPAVRSVRIAHPLLLEALYDGLQPSERRRLHTRLADAIERHAPHEVERLAWHLQHAGDVDPKRALAASTAAGERALARYGNQEAVHHLRTGSSIARLHQPAAAPGLLVTLGEAAVRAGDLAAAIAAWEEAAARHEAAGAWEAAGRLHRTMAATLAEWGRVDDALRHVEQGFGVLQGRALSELHVELQVCRLDAALAQADPEAAEAAADEVARLARRAGTERAAVLAALARGVSLGMRGALAAAGEILVDAQERLAHTDPRFLVRQEVLGAMLASFHGDLPSLRAANRRTETAALRVGIPASEHRLRLLTFVEHLYHGEWDRAAETLQEAELVAERTHHPRIGVAAPVMGVVLHGFRGDDDGARSSLCQLEERIERRLVPPGQGEKLLAILSAFLALEQDDPRRALRSVADARGHYLPELLPPWGWAVRGEAEARTGDAGAAVATAAALDRLGPASSYPQVMARRLRGLAALAEGSRDAAGVLGAAATGFTALGMPFEAARAALESVEAAIRTGVAKRATATTAAGVLRTMTGLEASRYVARARHVLAALGARAPAGAPGRRLTSRQHEVAVLVAEGLSNAEIAERLYLSVRTVESHLDHVYTRLGISSRVALATQIRTVATPSGSRDGALP